MTAMKEVLEFIARELVDDPDSVTVTEVRDGDAIVLNLRVADQDMGKVIGKQGRIAKAIRKVLNAGSTHEDTKIIVNIGD